MTSFAIYQLVDSSPVKFSSKSFSPMVSPDLLKKICRHSENFVEKVKDGNHLVQGLLNMIGVEQINLNLIFFQCYSG